MWSFPLQTSAVTFNDGRFGPDARPTAIRQRSRNDLGFMLRVGTALTLIAFEFTNVIQFITCRAINLPEFRRFSLNFSPYALQFLSYGVCLLLLLLDRGSARRTLQKPIARWIFVAGMIFTWSMLIRTVNAPPGFENYLFARPFALRMNALAFMLGCVLIFEDQEVLAVVKRAIVVATIGAIVLNLYEAIYPGTFDYISPGRAAGLYINPNTSGIAIAFGTVIGLTTLKRRWRELFLFLAGLAVTVTLSREAILAFAVVVVVAGFGRAISVPRLVFACALASTLFVAFDLATSLTESGILNDDLSRLTTMSDSSAQHRYQLAKMVLEKFEQAPLLGNGFDTAGYWAENESHNLYLTFVADHGVFGVLLIPALVLCLFRRSWDYYAFVAAFMLWCAFDHSLFGDSFALISLAVEADERTLLGWRRPARTRHIPVLVQNDRNLQGTVAG